ncbi:MAG: Ig-like domain-containing protein, partial [Actinomycetota bacterium]
MKWNGSEWRSIISDPNSNLGDAVYRGVGRPRTLAVFGGKLWAGGTFFSNESGSSGLAKWGKNLDPLIPTFSSSTTRTKESEFTFTVTFDEAVSEVGNSDFTNSGSLGSCTTAVSPVSSTVYTLTMSACSSALEGTVIPVFASGGATRAGGATGPAAAATSTAVITRDLTSPTMSSFSSTTSDGSYRAGQTVNVTATTNENISSGNTITVTLDTGATVTLTAASNGTSLTGTYTIGAGQNSPDLTVSSFAIGTVLDTAGNVMTSTILPSGTDNIAGTKAIVVDTTAPVAIGVPNLDAASDLGASSIDDITSDNTPTFTVVVTAREGTATGYVRATKSGSSAVTCTLNVGGTCTLGTLADGTWSIVAFQTDLAGNDSANSTALSVTIDTTAPTTVTLARSAATSTDSTITFTVTGTENLDCTTLSTTAGTDFTLTGISAISSIAQTSGTVCTITATSTATAGGGAVTST